MQQYFWHLLFTTRVYRTFWITIARKSARVEFGRKRKHLLTAVIRDVFNAKMLRILNNPFSNDLPVFVIVLRAIFVEIRSQIQWHWFKQGVRESVKWNGRNTVDEDWSLLFAVVVEAP
jgi:hypothetical protein